MHRHLLCVCVASSGPGGLQYAASCDEKAIVQGLSDRLLQAWLVPRCTTASPALSCTSSVSSTNVISPSSTRQKSSVRVFCMLTTILRTGFGALLITVHLTVVFTVH